MRERLARIWAKFLGRPYRPGGARGQFASQRYTSKPKR